MPLSRKMMHEPRQNSVTQLAELYNVVIGIALSLAIVNLIDESARPLPIHKDRLFGFIVFLVTVIPFYHGAVRHLFSTYVEYGGSSRIRNGALMLDFVLLFLEGCALVAMALLLGDIEVFLWGYVSLLIIDSAWGFLAWLAFTGASGQFAEKKWMFINCVTGLLIVVLMPLFLNGASSSFDVRELGALLAVAIGRTIADYAFCWNFYFPAGEGPAKPTS